jgi:hypothetical protein
MTIQHGVLKRLAELVEDAADLRRGEPDGTCLNYEQVQDCRAWIVSALHLVQIACPEANPYRRRAEHIAAKESDWRVNHDVGELAGMLKNLARDVEAGLLTSVGDKARAETFDDFLDHGRAYLQERRSSEAGVIAGVAFEDTIKRICRKSEIDTTNREVDQLISALVTKGILTKAKATRARAAAAIRNKATHADWKGFDLADVAAAIEITQELVTAHLDPQA